MSPNANNRDESEHCSVHEQDQSDVINRLRTAIIEDSLLNQYKFDDKFLLKFLRAREFDLQKTLMTLKGYVTKLRDRPDLFTWNPKTASQALKTQVFSYFLDGNTNGRQIFFLHPGRWDPKEVNLDTIISLVILCQEITLLDEQFQKSGVVVIIDMTGLSLNHLYKCGISNGKLISELTDKCIPINIINVHVVFQNWLTEMGYNLFKPFIDEELKRKIIFHGYNIGSIHQYCSKEVLPVKYGGTHEEADLDQLFKILTNENHKMLSIWEKYKTQ
ncbi:alpha-tocopherol transfer protein-like [Tetranychus urticae]|uniref:CRAL-TRIO domain-containing protein n=1 Tax=Tetranychus urticae TaxID=32264 RepID=T1JYN6_TETUR|nr:alpha-tocopherol transfer protein-like [Tetranychus urticae]